MIRMLKILIGADDVPGRHGSLLRALGRQGHHHGGLHRLLRRGVGPATSTPFFAWYEQAGTPTVKLEATYDAAAKALDLSLEQSTAPTPGPARQAAAADPARHRPAGRGRPACLRDTEVVVLDPPSRTRPPRGRAPRAGGLGPARLLGAGEPFHRRAGQGRLRAAGRRPGPVQPLGGRPGPGARPDPGARRRPAGRGRRGALRRGAGPGAEATSRPTRRSRRCCWRCPASRTWR